MESVYIESVSNTSFFGVHFLAYAIILIVVMLEAIPFIGLFIPGVLVVMGAGFLVKTQTLDVSAAIACATIGSVFADIISYKIGQKYGTDFFNDYGKFFFIDKEKLDKTEKNMDKHLTKAMLLGRFAPLTRPFTQNLAGALKIHLDSFISRSFFASVLWASLFIGLGYVFGQSYEAASEYIGEYFLSAFVIGYLIVSAYRFVNLRKHIFNKFQIFTLILNLLSLTIFAKIFEDVLNLENLTLIDKLLNNNVGLVRNVALSTWMVYATNLFSPEMLVAYAIVMGLYFISVKHWNKLILLITSFLFGGGSIILIKYFLQRTRPLDGLISITGNSFPSGHATMAAIFFCLMIYFFKNSIKYKFVQAFFVICMSLLTLIVGFSRFYLSVHWMSDVIAGIALGIFWVTFLVLFFRAIRVLTYKTLFIVEASQS